MRLLLLFLLVMLCMLGVLSLVRFFVRNFCSVGKEIAILIIPLRGSAREVLRQIRYAKQYLTWSEEVVTPIWLDDGVTASGLAQAVALLAQKDDELVPQNELGSVVVAVCKSRTNML